MGVFDGHLGLNMAEFAVDNFHKEPTVISGSVYAHYFAQRLRIDKPIQILQLPVSFASAEGLAEQNRDALAYPEKNTQGDICTLSRL